MGLELDPEFSPSDGQVGVVPGSLAQVADGVGEHEGCRPAVGVVLASQPAVFEVPLAQTGLFDSRLNFGVGIHLGFDFRHGVLLKSATGYSKIRLAKCPE